MKTMPVAMYRLMVGDDQPLHVWTLSLKVNMCGHTQIVYHPKEVFSHSTVFKCMNIGLYRVNTTTHRYGHTFIIIKMMGEKTW